MFEQIPPLMCKALTGSIRIYQVVVSPLLGRHCRFYPSCSEYTRAAIRKFGAWRGILLGAKRVLRCHPFSNSGGCDPVPEAL